MMIGKEMSDLAMIQTRKNHHLVKSG